MLFWLKGSGDTKLAEQLFTVDGVYGDHIKLAGNYLKKVADGDYRYSKIIHTYYSFDLYRMRFERGGKQYWVEAEVIAPGFVAFRFAYSGAWKTLAASLIAMDRYKALSGAIRAATFEDNAIIP